jgi:hypothetical protein
VFSGIRFRHNLNGYLGPKWVRKSCHFALFWV